MSSLKMGLDQAVLQGIENNGSSSGDVSQMILDFTYVFHVLTKN